MTYAVVVIRTLVGLLFLFIGLNYFLHFMDQPKPPGGTDGSAFADILERTGYMRFVKILEVVGGAMLVSRLFVPLGIVILTPVTVNIICYEIFLLGTPGIGCLLGALLVFLVFGYYRFFGPLLTPFASPHNPIGLKD